MKFVENAVAELDEDDYKEMWVAATAYNEALRENPDRWNLTEEEEYNSILDVTGTSLCQKPSFAL